MSVIFALPALFLVSAVAGIILCLAALHGLTSGRAYAPNLGNNPPGCLFIEKIGREGRIWAVIELCAGLLLIGLMLGGLSLYSDFRHSPAYIDSLIAPPSEKQVLYSAVKESGLEAIYVFDIDSEKVRGHYLAELEKGGWHVGGRTGAAEISAEKGGYRLRLLVIGAAPADGKDFRCKVIVSLDIL